MKIKFGAQPLAHRWTWSTVVQHKTQKPMVTPGDAITVHGWISTKMFPSSNTRMICAMYSRYTCNAMIGQIWWTCLSFLSLAVVKRLRTVSLTGRMQNALQPQCKFFHFVFSKNWCPNLWPLRQPSSLWHPLPCWLTTGGSFCLGPNGHAVFRLQNLSLQLPSASAKLPKATKNNNKINPSGLCRCSIKLVGKENSPNVNSLPLPAVFPHNPKEDTYLKKKKYTPRPSACGSLQHGILCEYQTCWDWWWFMDGYPPKDGTIFRISFEKCPHDPRWVWKGEGLSERSNFEKQMAPDQSVCDSLFA